MDFHSLFALRAIDVAAKLFLIEQSRFIRGTVIGHAAVTNDFEEVIAGNEDSATVIADAYTAAINSTDRQRYVANWAVMIALLAGRFDAVGGIVEIGWKQERKAVGACEMVPAIHDLHRCATVFAIHEIIAVSRLRM